ncbi:hypothetical protein N826_19290 [Skermanella aerolata KACC 11604]|nr:hypothetical protein N826_19290 [Skermanella aerolata KACC 11604]
MDVNQHRSDTLDLSHLDLGGKDTLILALLDRMATLEPKPTKSKEA